MKKYLILLVILSVVLCSTVGCATPTETTDASIDPQLAGTWKYELSAGGSGQALAELNLRQDGTFEHVGATVVSAGYGVASSKYGEAHGYKGKYKVTDTNHIVFYDILKGEITEKTNVNSLQELVKRVETRNVPVSERQYTYKLSKTDNGVTLVFEQPGKNNPTEDIYLLSSENTYHH